MPDSNDPEVEALFTLCSLPLRRAPTEEQVAELAGVIEGCEHDSLGRGGQRLRRPRRVRDNRRANDAGGWVHRLRARRHPRHGLPEGPSPPRRRRAGNRSRFSAADSLVAPGRATVATPLDADFRSVVGGSARTPWAPWAPAIAVPNGFSEGGLPTSLQFMGRAWEENDPGRGTRLPGPHRLSCGTHLLTSAACRGADCRQTSLAPVREPGRSALGRHRRGSPRGEVEVMYRRSLGTPRYPRETYGGSCAAAPADCVQPVG
jgi:hypothetical protein